MLEMENIPSAIVRMDDGELRKLTTEEEVRLFIKNFSFYSTNPSVRSDEAEKE